MDAAAEHPSTIVPRVCFALSTRGFAFGGLETVADHLASGLVARGSQVDVVLGTALGRRRRTDLPAGPRTVAVPVLAHDSLAARLLGRALRLPPLHVQSISFLAACLSRRAARGALLGADVGITFLEGEAALVSRLLARRGRASIAYLAGAIHLGWARADRSTRRVATSHTIAELYRSQGLACHAVVTPGVSADLLRGPAASPSEPRLLYVGRLESNKRVHWLLEVLGCLLPRFPNLRLYVVGDGPTRSALQAAVEARGLAPNVAFTGALAPVQVEAQLRRADVFVFPSAYESFGTVALEALAAGLPVVASDLPALREATGGHATLVPMADLDGWVAAVAELLSDPRLRAARAEAGRRWAAAFTWDRVLDRFQAVVEEAIQARPASTARPG